MKSEKLFEIKLKSVFVSHSERDATHSPIQIAIRHNFLQAKAEARWHARKCHFLIFMRNAIAKKPRTLRMHESNIKKKKKKRKTKRKFTIEFLKSMSLNWGACNSHSGITSRLFNFSRIFCDFIDFLAAPMPSSDCVWLDFELIRSSVSSSSEDVSLSESDEQDDMLLKSTLWNKRLIAATHSQFSLSIAFFFFYFFSY